MEVMSTPLAGVVRLQSDAVQDARGSFGRLSCLVTLAAHGIAFAPSQTSVSRSLRRGTLRGMHFQIGPAAETKIVHCIAGAIFDVALDLRPGSPSFRHAFGTELSAGNGAGLLIPAGCAHGLLTLTDDAAVLYQIDRAYDAQHARGVRWDDPAFAIPWPFAPSVLSDRDRAWPDFAG